MREREREREGIRKRERERERGVVCERGQYVKLPHKVTHLYAHAHIDPLTHA